jgi:hypothetical protein
LCPIALSLVWALKHDLSQFKCGQFLPEFTNLLVDGFQFGRGFFAFEIFWAQVFANIAFKLASEDSEVWVTPYRSLSVFKFARLYALLDEFAGQAIFFLGRYLAEDSALAIPFAIFGHVQTSPLCVGLR